MNPEQLHELILDTVYNHFITPELQKYYTIFIKAARQRGKEWNGTIVDFLEIVARKTLEAHGTSKRFLDGTLLDDGTLISA